MSTDHNDRIAENNRIAAELSILIEKYGHQWTQFGELMGEHPERLRSIMRNREGSNITNAESGYVSLPPESLGVAQTYIPGDSEISSVYVSPTKRVGLRFRKKRYTLEEAHEYLNNCEYERLSIVNIDAGPRNRNLDLLEIFVPDLHFGSNVDGYNPGDILDYLYNFIADLDEDEFEGVIFPVGNDLFHVDNSNRTTYRGTYVGFSGEYLPIFKEVLGYIVAIIDLLESKFNSVIIPVVAGNHDWDTVGILGVVLSLKYEDSPNVTIEFDEHKPRRYVVYNNTLIGYTHGNLEKHANLPKIMAAECPDLWGQAVYRYWHLGHDHHRSVKDYGGAVVETYPAVVPPDGWHRGKGFVGTQRGIILNWISSDYGITGSEIISIEQIYASIYSRQKSKFS